MAAFFCTAQGAMPIAMAYLQRKLVILGRYLCNWTPMPDLCDGRERHRGFADGMGSLMPLTWNMGRLYSAKLEGYTSGDRRS